MIYPPTDSTPTPGATPRKSDPDRQLALMLVVLAIATGVVFYAAHLAPADIAEMTGVDKVLWERFGVGSAPITQTVTAATEVATMAAPMMSTPARFPTSMPTMSFSQGRLPTAPSPSTFPGQMATETPIEGKGWPVSTPSDGAMTATVTPTQMGSAYPNVTPSDGYPGPGQSEVGETPERGKVAGTATAEPGER